MSSDLNKLRAEIERLHIEHQAFVYRVSHDLKAPIRHLQWYLEQIEEANDKHAEETITHGIAESFQTLDLLRSQMDDLLAYSRVSSQTQGESAVDCTEVLKAVVQRLQVDIETVGAKLNIQPAPCVIGSAKQLEILFLQLVKNSLVFHNKALTARISIESNEDRTQNPSLAQFNIIDNGIGVAAKHQPHVFEMFFRAVGRDYPGNGAGLAIAKRIVDRHRGTIQILSPNSFGGTTVRLQLPLAE
ncbi:sensor histidine kinase [Halioxenophilus aromaticivorans]|uniref:histidine kinase n=1 Tax=Halioxenophilus aromaticivorans TaxID=1306992 RepID=A0AAV3U5T5_9ALTE